MTKNTINSVYDNASLQAWGDLEEKHSSLHDNRDVLQSALENVGANPNLIAHMLGHNVKGVDFHYSDHSWKELLPKYKLALPYLTPKSKPQLNAELTQQKAQTQTLEQKNTELQKQVDDISLKIKEELKKMFPEIKSLYESKA